MISQVALFAAVSMAAFVAASPLPSSGGQCNTGPVQCCNQSYETKSEQGSFLLGLIGVSAQDVTGKVFSQCSPISAVGIGSGSSCGSSPVCCSNNNFNGLVVIGCSPINVSL